MGHRGLAGQDQDISLPSLAKPWRFLGPVPLSAAYTVTLLALLAVAYVFSVLMLSEIPGGRELERFDPVIVLFTALVPALSLWFSFWCVGAAVRRGASSAFGYLPIAITFLANTLLWLAIFIRLPDKERAWWLLPVLLVLWSLEVCVIINTYNGICGLAHFASNKEIGSLRAFFSADEESPRLPLVWVNISPSLYAMAAFAVGVLLLIPELISLMSSWMKHEGEFQDAMVCAVLRDFAMAGAAAASLAWYQSSLAFLRKSHRDERPQAPETCTLHIQYLPRHSETLLSFYLPNGRVGGRGSCANGDFAAQLSSRFNELLERTKALVTSSPCYRSGNSAAMPPPETFEKFLTDVGKDLASHYLVPEVKAALESFEAVISRSRDDTVLQIFCDELSDAIPWELLLIRGKYLCREFPTVRVRSMERAVERPSGRPHCVIVGASAQDGSDDFPELPDVIDEVNAVTETLTQSGWKVTALVDSEARIEDIRTVFKESDRVDVFHFTGHSQFLPTDLDHSFLRLHDGAKLYASRLIDLVRLKSPWLAFLNGCDSARTGLFESNAVRGLTNAMNEADVRYVLGMRWPITSSAGTVLASSFYQHLADTLSPELALWRARLEAALTNEYDDPSWGAPCLYRN